MMQGHCIPAIIQIIIDDAYSGMLFVLLGSLIERVLCPAASRLGGGGLNKLFVDYDAESKKNGPTRSVYCRPA